MTEPLGGAPTDCLIGIDLGTSAVKVAAFDPAGGLVGLVRGPTPTMRPAPGWVEHDADTLWATAAGLVRDLVEQLAGTVRVAGVAATSVGESGVLVDAAGRPVRPMIAWNDTRSAAQGQWWQDHVGLDEVHRIAGQSVDPHYGVNKLMWVRDEEPEAFARGATWLSMADWILLCLAGVAVTDPTLASRTMLFDQARGAWSADLVDASRVARSLLPDVVPCGTRVGGVTPDAARATGLPGRYASGGRRP